MYKPPTTSDDQLIASMQAVTNYAATKLVYGRGTCPPMISEEVMEMLADIAAMWPDAPALVLANDNQRLAVVS